jgi:hypothetical protein
LNELYKKHIGWITILVVLGMIAQGLELLRPTTFLEPLVTKTNSPAKELVSVQTVRVSEAVTSKVYVAPVVAPKPVVQVASVAYAKGCELYRPLVAQYGWDQRIAMAVMRAESGCNPMAANWKDKHSTCMGSFGLFQIACFDGQVYDPARNIQIAWQKYQARGWKPWGAFTSGAYKKYL